MTTLAARITALATAIGTDIKTNVNAIGSLSALNTTAKNNIVAALNEVLAAVGSGGVTINDSGTTGDTTHTYSVNKILALIAAAKSDLINGAGSALDTLNELAAALGNDANYATTVATALAARIRFDAAQTLSVGEQNQACANLNVGNPDTDFVATYNAAKA